MHVLEGLLIALDNLDAVIELIRGSRDRDAARDGPDRALRADADPGAGDPRAAPAAADRARGRRDQARARRQGRAHQRAARAARRRGQGLRADQGGAAEIAERYGDERRTEITPAEDDDRHRGPDRRPADGDHDHALGLHQVAAAGHLPPAAPRRRRRHRDGHEGRATTSSTSSCPRRTTTCCSSPTAARSTAPRSTSCPRPAARPRAAAWATCCRCARASACSRCWPRATSRRPSTWCSRPARASSRRPSSWPTTRRSRPTASSRSRSATTTS